MNMSDADISLRSCLTALVEVLVDLKKQKPKQWGHPLSHPDFDKLSDALGTFTVEAKAVYGDESAWPPKHGPLFSGLRQAWEFLELVRDEIELRLEGQQQDEAQDALPLLHLWHLCCLCVQISFTLLGLLTDAARRRSDAALQQSAPADPTAQHELLDWTLDRALGPMALACRLHELFPDMARAGRLSQAQERQGTLEAECMLTEVAAWGGAKRARTHACKRLACCARVHACSGRTPPSRT